MPAVRPGSLCQEDITVKRFRAFLRAVRFRYRKELRRYERTEPMPKVEV